MKKKILHLNTNLDVTSGVTRCIELLSKNLSNDFEHHVIVFQGDDAKACGSNTFLVINEIGSSSVIHKITMPFKIWRYIIRHRIDIVHSHHRYMDFVATLILRICDIRTITTVHSKVYGKKSLSYKSSTLIAVSNSIRDHLTNYYGVNDNRIRLINYFVDSEALICAQSREDMRSQLGIGSDEILLGYVGRIDIDEKGVDLLVSAFEILKKGYNGLRFMLVGGGKDLDLVERMDIEKNLKIIFVPGTKDVFDYFQCIDLFVLPSRIDPFPYVMLEAAALKIPIIAARVDGIPEFIDDGVNGLIFEKNNLNDLVCKIELMLSDETLRQELSMRLFGKVFAQYEKSRIIPEYIKLYNGNIAG